MAVDQWGNVHVADLRNDRIQVFEGDGTFVLKFGSTGGAMVSSVTPTMLGSTGPAICGQLIFTDTARKSSILRPTEARWQRRVAFSSSSCYVAA